MKSLNEELKKYNWSSDKDYQLAVIAFKDLFRRWSDEILKVDKSKLLPVTYMEDTFDNGINGTVKQLRQNRDNLLGGNK